MRPANSVPTLPANTGDVDELLLLYGFARRAQELPDDPIIYSRTSGAFHLGLALYSDGTAELRLGRRPWSMPVTPTRDPWKLAVEATSFVAILEALPLPDPARKATR